MAAAVGTRRDRARRARPPSGAVGAYGRALAALARHPALWSTAVRQVSVLARPGWWRTWPPLPVPAGDYLRFRMQTAYGGDGPPPRPGDVVTYLRWCRQWRCLSRVDRGA